MTWHGKSPLPPGVLKLIAFFVLAVSNSSVVADRGYRVQARDS